MTSSPSPEDIEQLARQNGFTKPRGEADDWYEFGMEDGQARIALSFMPDKPSEAWHLGVMDVGMARQLKLNFHYRGLELESKYEKGGFKGVFAFPNKEELGKAVSRCFQLENILQFVEPPGLGQPIREEEGWFWFSVLGGERACIALSVLPDEPELAWRLGVADAEMAQQLKPQFSHNALEVEEQTQYSKDNFAEVFAFPNKEGLGRAVSRYIQLEAIKQLVKQREINKPLKERKGWFWLDLGEGQASIALAFTRHKPTAPWHLGVVDARMARQINLRFPQSASDMGAQTRYCKDSFTGVFAFPNKEELGQAISLCTEFWECLPSAPLKRYKEELKKSPGKTETMTVTRQRIGQDIFRKALVQYWGACPLTGVSDQALLRASHILPWADCVSDDQRLNVFNGLLLCADWDAAFDAGLVSFTDNGQVLVKKELSQPAREYLGIGTIKALPLETEHCIFMRHHREKFGFPAFTDDEAAEN